MNTVDSQHAAPRRTKSTTRCPRSVARALCAVPLAALLVCTARAADSPASTVPPPSAAVSSVPDAPAARSKAVGDKAVGDKAKATAGEAQPRSAASPYTPDRFTGRAGLHYRLIWGIDSISVRVVESGELVRFSYRVLDPEKARVLNDKQTEATLNDPKAGVSLVVPTMEKVGQLRQTSTPEVGRSYWMTFSNKGRRVARGDRVDVVIGSFRANNLVVD